ncbi:MAG: GDP-mannose 4,6-dehydratase [Candidatus Aenigmatarchaeota archaeon]
MRILVTGGAGFIGSHLAEYLSSYGNEIIVYDNFSSGKLSNLSKNRNIKIIKGDIRNIDVLFRVSKDCEKIYHLAEFIPETKKSGEGHIIKFSVEKPLSDLKVNVGGTINVLEVARRRDCKVIFTSSAAVYGNYKQKIKENYEPKPISPYGVFKYTCELLLSMYSKLYGIEFAIARIFNSYGPRQRKYLFYDALLKLKKNPNKLVLLGNGEQKRDFIYVKDTVKALFLIDKKVKNDVVNVGNGNGIKILDAIKVLLKIKGINPKIRFTGTSWLGDIKILVSDNTKLKSLGYKPSFNLQRGMIELIKWFEKTH